MEQNFGLISIIMAAYNAENTIEKAVMSVIAQTYTQFELIIINVFLIRADMDLRRQGENGLLFLTVMMPGRRINWKSRSGFKKKKMQIWFIRVLLLWIRLEIQ